MAFEKISEYTDTLAKEYERTGNERIVTDLFLYYHTVLQTAKFKGQRQYCEKVLHIINPAFYKGAFKKDCP